MPYSPFNDKTYWEQTHIGCVFIFKINMNECV